MTVTATDPQGASVSTSYVLNVVPAPAVNQPPVLTGTGITSPQSATVGVAYSTTTAGAFSDPDGGPLTYSASTLPAGVSIDPQTGIISGTPSTTVGSPFTVTVTATDPQGASVSTSYVLNVVPAPAVNQPPVLTGTGITSPQSATVGVAYSTTTAGAFSDPDGGPLTYSASTLPSGVSIDPQTGVISGTPSTTVGSPFTVTVTATDPQGASVSTSYVLNVVPAATNTVPFAITGVTVVSCQTLSVGQRRITIQPQYAGLDGSAVSFWVRNESMPTTAAGPYSFDLYTDNPQITLQAVQQGVTAMFVYNWLASACGTNPTSNQPPVLTGTGITSPQSATVGVAYSTTTAGAFSDPDGGPLTYSASTLPSGVSIDPQTGVISGTPSTTVGSPFTVTVTATDPQGASVSTSYVLNVVPAATNTVPFAITGVTVVSCQTLSVGQRRITIQPQYAGLDGSAVSFWVRNESMPTTAAGPYSFDLYTDNPQITLQAVQQGVTAMFVYNWLASACGTNPTSNQPPVLTGTGITSPQSATVGVAYSTTTAGAFSDPDGGPLTYSASTLPSGVSIDPQTGVISGTPSTTVGSPFTVTVTATDPQGASVSTSYVLNVVPAATQPPVVCGSNSLDGSPLRALLPIYNCQQVQTSGEVQFTAAGGNATGGPIEFMAISVTNWTTNCHVIIDRETRTSCDASPIEVRVRQLVNGSYVYGRSFIFDIRRLCPIATCPTPPIPNRAPYVQAGIADQTAVVGQHFTFMVPEDAFADPDGNSLIYTSSRLPDSFTFSSGFYSAIPTVAQTLSVTATVYDNYGGQASTTFNIIVQPASSARLTRPSSEPHLLNVRVLGNPVLGKTVDVEVQGAEGDNLRLSVVDSQGYTISESSIEQASELEKQTLRMGDSGGFYFLRVTTPTTQRVIKLLKP